MGVTTVELNALVGVPNAERFTMAAETAWPPGPCPSYVDAGDLDASAVERTHLEGARTTLGDLVVCAESPAWEPVPHRDVILATGPGAAQDVTQATRSRNSADAFDAEKPDAAPIRMKVQHQRH